MQNAELYQIDENRSVIKSSVRQLHATNDKKNGPLPASLTNRTLYLGFASDGTPQLWIESQLRGYKIAPDNAREFAPLLAYLTDNEDVERGQYARVREGRRLFEGILAGLRESLSPNQMESLRKMAAEAEALARKEAVAYADVILHLKHKWYKGYLPEGATEQSVSDAWGVILGKCKSLGLQCLSFDTEEPRTESPFDIADECGDSLPDDVCHEIGAIVLKALGDRESWAKKQKAVASK